ncbi:MAG: amidohydrolase [Bilifractor sp.]
MNRCIRSRNVFTGTGYMPEPLEILVRDNTIAQVRPYDPADGSMTEKNVKDEDGTEYKVEDFGEKLVMPGLIDAHTHFFTGALTASDYVCSGIEHSSSEENCAGMVKAFADAHPDLDVIRGNGWFMPTWGTNVLPTKNTLDRLIPDRPVVLRCADAHSYWLNSAALKHCGISPTWQPAGGSVGKLPDGSLSGMLIEPEAYEPADKLFRTFPDDQMKDIIASFEKELAGYGITAVSEMFAWDYTEEYAHKCALVQEMDHAGELTAHLYLYPRLFDYDDFTSALAWKKKYESESFRIPGVKGFLDGVAETHTGLFLEPYSDRTDTCGIGVPLKDYDSVLRSIIAANRAGLQVRLHCIADGSVRMALDLYEEAQKTTGPLPFSNTIEHIETLSPSDASRFRALHVIPSMQPAHLVLDENGKLLFVGKDRIRWEWPFRTMAETSGALALGTDYPVVSIDPFRTIYTAVTRCDYQGKPTGYNPEEKLTMMQTLMGYTANAAAAYHQENEIGSLQKGKRADLVVLDHNLFMAEPEQIMETRPLLTVYGGKDVYRA